MSEKPEEYVREFEREFPQHVFVQQERDKLLALFENCQLEAWEDGAPQFEWS